MTRGGKKKAEFEKIKSEFISVASHKMRSPLSAIKWYAESLLAGDAGKLTEDQKCFVQQIFLSNRRLINLIDDLLRVARVERGAIEIKHQKVNLDLIVREIIRKTKNEARRKKIKLGYSGGKAEINGDADKIKQIFFNLLDNAIKYNSVGGKVDIGIAKDKNNYLCEVSDSGIGIPRNEQKMIFTKFFRAYNIVTMNTEGNGLSLYLAKAYIESHGGKIWLESAPGKGSRFYFTLPIKQ
jgi:signal transduction histidine kinase